LEDAGALLDEEDLVALAVAVEDVGALRRLADRDLDLAVPHQQAPAVHRVALRAERPGLREAVDVGVGHPLRPLDRGEVEHLRDAAGGDEVVEDRLVAAEGLVAHDLLDEQAPVAAELDVALGGDLAQPVVAHGASSPLPAYVPTGCRAAPGPARSPRRVP